MITGDFEKAVKALRAGEAVVFPTDTVYGVGVSVMHAGSPDTIYALKKRDAGKPIAWLVDGAQALDRYGVDVPETARALAQAHWPGALTIIVKASDAVPRAFRSEAGTVGLRMPADEVALGLVRAVGPIAASSANVSGGSDAGDAAELDPALTEQVCTLVADGASAASGVSSTVVDCSSGSVRVLRQGDVQVV